MWPGGTQPMLLPESSCEFLTCSSKSLSGQSTIFGVVFSNTGRDVDI